MSYPPTFAALLLADADDGQGSPIAIRLEGEEARSMAHWRRRAFDHPQVTKRIQVMGCHAEELLYGEADDDWDPLMSPDWEAGNVSGARVAMQAIPLMDGFFLAVCDDSPMVSLATNFDLLVETYLRECTNFVRIVVPTINGEDAWPWLIDIGFRQPFVELANDGNLASVLQENAKQVRRVAIPE